MNTPRMTRRRIVALVLVAGLLGFCSGGGERLARAVGNFAAALKFNATSTSWAGATGSSSGRGIRWDATQDLPIVHQASGVEIPWGTSTSGLPTAVAVGDTIAWNGTSWSRIAVGTNGQVLTADNTQPAGVKWAAGGGSTGNWTFSGNNADLTGAGAMGLGPVTATSIVLGGTGTTGRTLTLSSTGVAVVFGGGGTYYQMLATDFRPLNNTLTLGASGAGWTGIYLYPGSSILTSAQGATNTVGITFSPDVVDGASTASLRVNAVTALSSGRWMSFANAGVDQGFVYPSSTTGIKLASKSANGFVGVDDGTGAYMIYSTAQLAVGSVQATINVNFNPQTNGGANLGGVGLGWNNLFLVGGGAVDTNAAAALNLANGNASALNLGRSGITVNSPANTITFSTNTSATGKNLNVVTVGATDTNGNSLTISSGQAGAASATGGGVGGTMFFSGGIGGAATGALAGGAGGVTDVFGGTGGAGTASASPGSGGAVVVSGGNAGTSGGSGGANGGSVQIQGGTGSGTGSNGNVNIGTSQTTQVQIGPSGGGVTLNLGRGTVTQATSITTGVTVNTPSMAITTVSTTLAAASQATFTVTNSSVVAASVVVCGLGAYSGTFGTNGMPDVSVGTISAGSFQVNVQNQDRTNALSGTLKIYCVAE